MKFEIINIKRDQRIEKNNKTASIYMYMLNFYITTTVIEPNILLLIINYFTVETCNGGVRKIV